MEARTEQGQHHGIVVGHDEEVDTVQRCTRLQIAERLPELAVLRAVTYINLNTMFKLTKQTPSNIFNTHRALRISEYVTQVVKTVCDLGNIHTESVKCKISGVTCQQVCGDFLSRMYCVRGDGSSSYLSNGTLSTTIGSASKQENRTIGWAIRGGCA